MVKREMISCEKLGGAPMISSLFVKSNFKVFSLKFIFSNKKARQVSPTGSCEAVTLDHRKKYD